MDPYQDPRSEPQGLNLAEQAAIAVVAAYLATTTAVAAVALPASLVGQLTSLGLSRRAVRAAGRLTLDPPLTGRTSWGSPTPAAARPRDRGGAVSMTRLTASNEPTMRARYLLAAAKRLTRTATERRFTAGLRRERTYLDAHRRAGIRRARIARDYDRLARRHQYLKWVAVLDDRTTPDCAARHGSVWSVSNPPFPPPGAQHVACRCVSAPASTPSPRKSLALVAR